MFSITKNYLKGNKMTQEFKTKFYKKIKEFYLFKVFESFDNKPFTLMFISVYKDMNKTIFVCESGAGITQERMENQIKKVIWKWSG